MYDEIDDRERERERGRERERDGDDDEALSGVPTSGQTNYGRPKDGFKMRRASRRGRERERERGSTRKERESP